ncbi:putative membrane protein YGL010W [Tahibacter aquaticus]|uniref:Putative membrane protein YGL010W n=1 Tax=Tahibacter aquaticus TaxID=520092 RepID=A0A4R6YN61_9GAMM|nr:Mpo1-like protein [Tahibacter aquaticus]TDR38978.1 putative membrane protein YGL010W [Tahibacter aquaticus]
MNSTVHTQADPRREVDRWLGNYAEDHRNATNVLIHWICVPAILWTVIAALWVVPVPALLGRAGLWAGVAMFLACAFYLRLSRMLGLAMFLVFVAFSVITELLFRELGPANLLYLAIGVFVVAWIAQFIGHHIEGKRPSFLTDLAYLLIGPAWIVAKLLRRAGVRY